MSPVYGKAYYNPDNLPLPTQNLNGAIQNISKAGNETGFYVKIGNREYGDTSGEDLSSTTFRITGFSPETTIESASLSDTIASFSHIGLTFSARLVTESTVDTWTSNTSTPQFIDHYWEPDYPDPVSQQLIAMYSPLLGGAFGGNKAWVDNGTLNNYFKNLDFESKTTQENLMRDNVSKLVYNQYANIWLPVPDAVYFVAPSVHGFEYNSIAGYYYNLMTVTGKLTSSVGYLSLYTLVADIEMAFTNATPKF